MYLRNTSLNTNTVLPFYKPLSIRLILNCEAHFTVLENVVVGSIVISAKAGLNMMSSRMLFLAALPNVCSLLPRWSQLSLLSSKDNSGFTIWDKIWLSSHFCGVKILPSCLTFVWTPSVWCHRLFQNFLKLCYKFLGFRSGHTEQYGSVFCTTHIGDLKLEHFRIPMKGFYI